MDQREALVSNFLTRNLPSAIEYPSGELFDAEDRRSGQIDIILLPQSSPKLHLFGAITLAPVDAVLGSVEVKSNLSTGGEDAELTRVLKHCQKLKALKRSADRSMIVEFLNHQGEFRTCPYILFAYKGARPETVLQQLDASRSDFHLESMPDLIVVLEPEYVLAKRSNWMNAGATAESVYYRGDSAQPALFYLYAFVLGLVEFWGANQALFTLPLSRYVEEQAALRDLFED
ncbi:MAG: hypothetical protein QM757_25825 [Paludibaculum sp.]